MAEARAGSGDPDGIRGESRSRLDSLRDVGTAQGVDAAGSIGIWTSKNCFFAARNGLL